MALLGGLIGLVGSFLFELTVFPPLLILFSIDSRIEKENKKDSIGNENKQKSDASTENLDYSQSWYCEKCGTANNNNSETCKKCGAKKSKILV